MSDGGVRQAKVHLRAHAMRLADVISRLEFEKNDKQKILGQYLDRNACSMPLLSQWPEIDLDPLLPENSDRFYLLDDGAQPAVWPLYHAFAFQFNGGLRISIIKTLEPKKVRGIARRFSKYNVEQYSMDIDEYGKVVSQGGGYYGRFDKKWSSLIVGGHYAAGCYGEISTLGPAISIGAALRARYEWSAVFSFQTGTCLRFGCSAAGALALFNDRDKPESGRRAAILHWVRRHWRATSDAKTASEVRRHLRGVTKFDWRGMDVSIVPAEFEIESAATE